MVDQVHISGFDAAALKALAAAIKSASSTLPASTPYAGRKTGLPGQNNKDPIKATSRSIEKLGAAAENLTSRFGKLDRSIKLVTGSFGKMLAAQGPIKGSRPPSPPERTVNPAPADDKKASDGLMALGAGAGRVGGVFGRLAAGTASLFSAFTHLYHLVQPVTEIFDDVFKLQRRGISAQENLVHFYLAAGKAGMSLKDYIKLIEENTALAARSAGFKDFNDKIEQASGALAHLGVFGAAARTMSATMMSSATTLGVPQEQLGSVVSDQIKVFKSLRDVTGITSQAFEKLVQDFSQMEEVQSKLLGMAPAERDAARKDLFASYTLGQQMGLTAEQSRRLGDALLAQRKLTAVDRFKAQGGIRQAGAITGMRSDETEELAKLALKKNRSEDENRRFIDLGGRLQAGLEAMQNSGNVAAENIADQLQAILPNSDQLKTAGQAKLTTDSGQVQKNFAQSTGDFGAAVGKFATTVEGIQQNPIWKALIEIGKIFGSLVALTVVKKGLDRVLGGAAVKGAGIPAQGTLASLRSTAGTVNDVVAKMATGLQNPLQTLRDVGTKNIGTLEGIGQGVGKGVGSIVNAVKAVPSAFVSAGRGLTSSTGALTSSIGRYIGMFTALLKDGASAGKEGLKATELIMQEGRALMSGAGKLASRGLEGMAGIIKGAGSTFKAIFGPEIGFIFGAVEELFTGELTKALDLGDGIFGRILGAVVGGFNGIFTSVSRIFDDSVNWLLEGLGINFKVNTTKFFDYVTGGVVDGWKMIGSILMKTLATIIETVVGIFGLKAPFVQGLRKTASNLDDSLAKSSATREEMWNTEGATLRSIGEKQIKAEATLADKADKTSQRFVGSTDKTVNGIEALVQSAQRTVETAQTGVQTSSILMPIATPMAPARQSVTPPEVNKPQAEDKKEAPAHAATPVDNMTAVLALLQQQLDVAKQQLAAMAKKEEPVAPLARASLPSTADMTASMYALGA